MTGTFEGIGSLQFTPDNKMAYAYSGNVASSSSDITLLRFTTGSEYHNAIVQYWYNANGSGYNIKFHVQFNDVEVAVTFVTDSFLDEFTQMHLVIPPFTDVHIQVTNESSGTESVLASFTSKVYGAIEQENLEEISDNNKWASL